jgi:hypothetical protein
MKRILISESEKRTILNQHKKAGYTISEQSTDVYNTILNAYKKDTNFVKRGKVNGVPSAFIDTGTAKISFIIEPKTGTKRYFKQNSNNKVIQKGNWYIDTKTNELKTTPDKPSQSDNSNTTQWVQAPSENDIAQGKKIMKMGMMGDSVKKIQQELKLSPTDSKFGKDTYNAVVKFQKSKGLKPDGIVGKDTYRELMVGVTPDMEKAQAERIKSGQDSSAIQPPTA